MVLRAGDGVDDLDSLALASGALRAALVLALALAFDIGLLLVLVKLKRAAAG